MYLQIGNGVAIFQKRKIWSLFTQNMIPLYQMNSFIFEIVKIIVPSPPSLLCVRFLIKKNIINILRFLLFLHIIRYLYKINRLSKFYTSFERYQYIIPFKRTY